MYDNLIIQVDKKEQRQTHTQVVITGSCRCTEPQLEGNIATLYPPSLRAKNERQSKRERVREKKQERECMCERESLTALPKSLNMTHALNSLKQLGIKSSLGPRKLSFHSELLFMTQAIVLQGHDNKAERPSNQTLKELAALSLRSAEVRA